MLNYQLSVLIYAIRYYFLSTLFCHFNFPTFHLIMSFSLFFELMFSSKIFITLFIAILSFSTTKCSLLLMMISYDYYFVWYFSNLYFLELHSTRQVSEISAHIFYSALKIIFFDYSVSLMVAVIISGLKCCCFHFI